MMSSRSVSRVALITAGFICAGALQGALIGILSMTPVWIDEIMRPRQYSLFDWWNLLAIMVVGAPMGAILGPVFGWLLIDRAPLWRILGEPTIAAIIGSWVAWVFIYFVPVQGGTTQLVAGAFLGAVLATARLRFQGRQASQPKATSGSASW